MSVDDLLVEAEVRRVVMRYCRGVDRLDAEMVRSCYHPGATDSHGNFEGSVEEFIEWAFDLLRKYDLTMHFVGNVLVERHPTDPNVASCESYGIAWHRREGGEAHRNLTTAFRYVDRFERRDGQWRIARRVVVAEWVQHAPSETWWPIPEVFLTGRRDGSDIVYDLDR